MKYLKGFAGLNNDQCKKKLSSFWEFQYHKTSLLVILVKESTCSSVLEKKQHPKPKSFDSGF